MFVFTRSEFVDKHGITHTPFQAIAVIHSDDCDVIGSDDHILYSNLNACHDEWEVKEVNANFMLGVKREVKINDNRTNHDRICRRFGQCFQGVPTS